MTRTYIISDCNGEEFVGTFYETKFPKTNQTEYRVKKLINRKGHKLCAKWKSYDTSINIELMKRYCYMK